MLLSPGQWQFDLGLTYAVDDTLLPTVLSNNLLDNTRIRRRTLVVPFAVRFGITPSIQAFVNAPVGWGQTELASPEFDTSRNVGGIGDVSAGVNVLVEPGSGGAPDIVLTLGMVAPSGNDAFGPSLNDASLGSGFWSGLADLRLIHSYDPVIVFYGAGYRLQFQRKVSGVWVDPGDEITYQLGVGLAINDRVTLSGAVLGSVITETEIDGRGLPGSLLEPVRVRLALTSVTPAKKKIVEPFVIFGVTPDATNVELGVIVTRFGSSKAGGGARP
ncbi:MAG: transporter [Pirellulaceae bacterium]|nr:transporter [Pirellulaceae bacterium]